MPNPLAGSRFYARLGNVFTRPTWSLLRPPEGFGVLTTIGRKSGKPRRQSVRAIREGQRVVIVAMMGERAHWLRNVRSHPHVTVKLRDGIMEGIAHEVTDDAERQWAAKMYVETTVPNDYLDYVVYEWGIPTRRKITEAHARWFEDGVPVTVDISDPAKEPVA